VHFIYIWGVTCGYLLYINIYYYFTVSFFVYYIINRLFHPNTFSHVALVASFARINACYHPECDSETVTARIDAFPGDKVLYHRQLRSLQSAEATVCAGKRFNRDCIVSKTRISLSVPRFSASVFPLLTCRTVLRDKARSCRFVREPFSPQCLLRGCQALSDIRSLRNNREIIRSLSRASLRTEIKALYARVWSRVLIALLSTNFCIRASMTMSIHTGVYWGLQFTAGILSRYRRACTSRYSLIKFHRNSFLASSREAMLVHSTTFAREELSSVEHAVAFSFCF